MKIFEGEAGWIKSVQMQRNPKCLLKILKDCSNRIYIFHHLYVHVNWWCLVRGAHPPKANDGFLPCFRFPPLFRIFLITFFSHWPWISNFPLIFAKTLHFPLSLEIYDSRTFLFPPWFRKIYVFLAYFTCFSFPPTLSMIHLCITQWHNARTGRPCILRRWLMSSFIQKVITWRRWSNKWRRIIASRTYIWKWFLPRQYSPLNLFCYVFRMAVLCFICATLTCHSWFSVLFRRLYAAPHSKCKDLLMTYSLWSKWLISKEL